MVFGALVGLGAAYDPYYEDASGYDQEYSSTSESYGMYGQHDGDHDGGDWGDHGGDHDGSHWGDHDSDNWGGHHGYYDWLSPGGAYYWTYPSYYYSSWYYPTYTYTYYPQYYYYTPPVTYSTWQYTPAVYDWVADPWWAANVYGVGGTTYHYSSSSSWSYHSGFFFGP